MNGNCYIVRLSDEEAKVRHYQESGTMEVHLVVGQTYKIVGDKRRDGRTCTLEKILKDYTAHVRMEDTSRATYVDCDVLLPV